MYNSQEYKQRVTFFNEKIKNIKKQKNDIINLLQNNNNVLYICDSCKNRFEIPILDYMINATCPKCNTTKKIRPIELVWDSILELIGLDKKNIKQPYPVYNSGHYEHKNNLNKYTNSKKKFIDNEFYPSGEKQNTNDTQDKLVYENLSPQDIENLQEILESTNPDTPRIIKCHNCGSKLRVPAHKKIEITCPHCKATRRLAT